MGIADDRPPVETGGYDGTKSAFADSRATMPPSTRRLPPAPPMRGPPSRFPASHRRPVQARVDPCGELRTDERLGDVVVRAGGEDAEEGVAVGVGGQEEDGEAPPLRVG